MNQDNRNNDEIFDFDSRIKIGTIEVTIEEMYQAFKKRYLREENELLAETVESPNNY